MQLRVHRTDNGAADSNEVVHRKVKKEKKRIPVEAGDRGQGWSKPMCVAQHKAACHEALPLWESLSGSITNAPYDIRQIIPGQNSFFQWTRIKQQKSCDNALGVVSPQPMPLHADPMLSIIPSLTLAELERGRREENAGLKERALCRGAGTVYHG